MTYLQAAIFDLDGVMLNTAELHYIAWKTLFDTFLKKYSKAQKKSFTPFSKQDYLYYVDGISRLDGVQSFLKSRAIELPTGSSRDEDLQDSIYGLAQCKDQIFHDLIMKQGVTVFSASIQFIESLRQQGIKTAVISASKNCKMLLQRTGIEHLFDAEVDGTTLEQKHLPGKPAPDTFLEAARLLQVSPENAMVVEDALAGVQAGRTGGFGLIVGVDRTGLGTQVFREHGADLVVTELDQLVIEGIKHWFSYRLDQVFDRQNKLNRELSVRLAGKQLVLFLDYDGTLTPIVDRPELALLDAKMRDCLQQLSWRYTLMIISGRELRDLQNKVNLPGIYYAGNHGLEIAGPDIRHIEGREYITEMEQVYQDLTAQLGAIPGIFIENKKFSLSVHFRLVDHAALAKIHGVIQSVLQDHPKLVRHEGKKIFEIRPNIDWHKGKAIQWLLTALKLNRFNIMPLYIGDDVTDEDAFRSLKPYGISIIVTSCKQTTKAQYCLRNTEEVRRFLMILLEGIHE